MEAGSNKPVTPDSEVTSSNLASSAESQAVKVAIVTGCQDRHYAFGLAMALASANVFVDVLGSDEVDSLEMHSTPNLRFFNFRRGHSSELSFVRKLSNLMIYYASLIRYALRSDSAGVLHVLWNYKLEYFDRTFLMLYFKAVGKKVVITAHNVNQARRDGRDSWLNRLTLRVQYSLCSQIFVHTEKMRRELCRDYGVSDDVITVIRYPINNAFPNTGLAPEDAKRRLGLRQNDKAILFFGRIVPYKGLEYLVEALRILCQESLTNYKLIIAGEPKKDSLDYWNGIQRTLGEGFSAETIVLRTEFIVDEDIEVFLKAADVMALPYREIFQSGILIMAYTYGLPIIATDVGSFAEDIVEGQTGYVCRAEDPADMAKTIEKFFSSEMYVDLAVSRKKIADFAKEYHSWEAVAVSSVRAYKSA